MSRLIVPAALALSLFAAPALAQNGGDRTPAGGAFMSSYSANPYAARAQQEPGRGGAFMAGRGDVAATGSLERRPVARRR